MSNYFSTRIISPMVSIIEEKISLATLPGEEGMFGVLKGHVNLIANLKYGVVELVLEDGKRQYYVHGGVAKIDNGNLTILSDFILDLSSNGVFEVNEQIKEAQEKQKQFNIQDPGYDLLSVKIKKYQTALEFIK